MPAITRHDDDAEDDDDDEDWYDEDDDLDEVESALCPECGGPVHSLADRCPACGYWLSEADRRAMCSGMRKPAWIKLTAIVLIAVFLLGLLGVLPAIF